MPEKNSSARRCLLCLIKRFPNDVTDDSCHDIRLKTTHDHSTYGNRIKGYVQLLVEIVQPVIVHTPINLLASAGSSSLSGATAFDFDDLEQTIPAY